MPERRTTRSTELRGEPSSSDRGTVLDQEKLARSLSRVAREFQQRTSVDAVLADTVAAAVRLIPGAEEGSISRVADRRTVTCEHPTSDLPRQVDALQTETGEGPCLDAAFEQQTVRVGDMRHEQRWPRFASRAADLGVGSMLSFQLYVEKDNLGALNLYHREPDVFSDESEMVGLIFASHAAIAFADRRQVEHLRSALDSRNAIGQAQGMLMERYGIDTETAFRVLSRISQDNNVKLVDLAHQLITTRNLPDLT